ncbi:MAG: hypothetical protein FJZ47_08500 [Candidatus Tectomicrobia bacterium]|uniref:ABC transmembrane type-1 domain-containing protein n=1 Tax=Tectimicrobiota bacterium TaxID=2528274 RepID=A0A937W1P2_UNCTE|nr:hypothetical protein [Candidatus Tectomicrobia bacterium]
MSAWFLRSWTHPLLGLMGMLCLVFVLPHLMSKSPITLYEGWPANPQQRASLLREYGFERSLPVQYTLWLQRLVTGQWGASRYYQRPVFHDIIQGLGLTLLLLLWTLLASGLIILGLWGLHRLAPWFTALFPQHHILCLLEAAPGFLGAIFLRELIIWQLGWVSMANLPLFEPYYFLNPLYMLLPALPLTLTPLRLWYTRPQGHLTLQLTLRERWQNFRVNLCPALELFLLEVSLTESVFAFPGLGHVGIEALKRRDVPVLQGFMLCTGVLYLLVRLWCTGRQACPQHHASPWAFEPVLSSQKRIWGLVLLLTVVLLAPTWIRYDPMEIHSRDQFLAPGYRYTLGTDFLGRDILSRTLQGFRSSLPRVLGVTLLIGGVSWLILGSTRRRSRWFGMLWQGGLAFAASLPSYILAFMAFLICESQRWSLEIALASAGLPAAARLLTTPVSRAPYLAQLASLGSGMLVLEVVFTFLNLHTESYTSAWGSDLRHGMHYGHINIWMVIAPACAITWSRYSLQQLSQTSPPSPPRYAEERSKVPATTRQNASEDGSK